MKNFISRLTFAGLALAIASPCFAMNDDICRIGYGSNVVPFAKKVVKPVAAVEKPLAIEPQASESDVLAHIGSLTNIENGLRLADLELANQDVFTRYYDEMTTIDAYLPIVRQSSGQLSNEIKSEFESRWTAVRVAMEDPVVQKRLADAGLRFGPELGYLPRKNPLPPDILAKTREINLASARFKDEIVRLKEGATLSEVLPLMEVDIQQAIQWVTEAREYSKPKSGYDQADIILAAGRLKRVMLENREFMGDVIDEAWVKWWPRHKKAAVHFIEKIAELREPLDRLVARRDVRPLRAVDF